MSTSGDLDVRAETTPAGVVVVHVSGDLDLATAPRLEEAFAGRPQGSRVVIDLAECTFLDSSGVRVLASAAGAVAESGGRLDLVVTDPGLIRVLAITSMDTLIDIHPSLEAAL
ncbi:MAG TPA: STAS domain-containing protein [Gaiellaceae bacterium]|nr:STAS domain-containing protein [Gaiellaceae bacterium]